MCKNAIVVGTSSEQKNYLLIFNYVPAKSRAVIEDGPFGGDSGSNFTDGGKFSDGGQIHLNGPITSIELKAGSVVYAIRVRYL